MERISEINGRRTKDNLDKQTQSCDITLTPFDNQRLFSLCGRLDEHLKLIESRLQVEIINRGNAFQIKGSKENILKAQTVLENLYKETKGQKDLSPDRVHLCIKEILAESNHKDPSAKDKHKKPKNHNSLLSIKTNKGFINPRTPNQEIYVKNILDHDINFGIGPAGTGKTFLAVSCAVTALEEEKVSRILLVRPAVEAGERLGFLPGDLSQKIDPYLRPLYDALHEMLGADKVNHYLERQIIEIAPLAYMRGRTLNDAFIILDESQNTTHEQMKMFLTRIGFSSTAVITGDVTQVDLPHGKGSGLRHALKVLKHVDNISFTFFESSDVVRHPVVQQIIEAYEDYEKGPNETTSK